MLATFTSPLFTSSVHPVATTMEQAEQLFDRIVGCQVNKPVSEACPHCCRKLSDRRIQRADFYEGLVMSLVWKHLSAAGHIAFYQSLIHASQTNNDGLKQRAEGEQMSHVLDDGIVESTEYCAGLTGKNFTMSPSRSLDFRNSQAGCFCANLEDKSPEKSKLQIWDDLKMPRAEKPDPMAAQLEQALHYSQSQVYDALTTQTCGNAIRAFDHLTKDLTTDRIGQMVVVMDIDGTVVNNSPWIAGLCSKGQLSTQESHSRWAVSQQAKAIKGVVELVGAYRKKKVPVIWVSNRTPGLKLGEFGEEVRRATKAHLKKLGLFEDGEQILLKGDFSGKDSTGKIDTHKRHRFDAIRQGLVIPGRTDIVQMVGDDPADLGIDTEPFYNIDSDTWPAKIKDELGTKLILMPNPLFYRGWQRDLVRHLESSGKPLGNQPADMAEMNRLERGR